MHINNNCTLLNYDITVRKSRKQKVGEPHCATVELKHISTQSYLPQSSKLTNAACAKSEDFAQSMFAKEIARGKKQ